jgi:hypothetical protein
VKAGSGSSYKAGRCRDVKWSHGGSSLTIELRRAFRPWVEDSHHFDEEPDPDPFQSERPDPHPDYIKVKCWYRIRIRIKVKSQIRI